MEKRGELEKRGMRLSHIRPASEPLKLGRLQGNHFDLVVRDLKSHGSSGEARSGAETRRRLAGLVEEALQNVQVGAF